MKTRLIAGQFRFVENRQLVAQVLAAKAEQRLRRSREEAQIVERIAA